MGKEHMDMVGESKVEETWGIGGTKAKCSRGQNPLAETKHKANANAKVKSEVEVKTTVCCPLLQKCQRESMVDNDDNEYTEGERQDKVEKMLKGK